MQQQVEASNFRLKPYLGLMLKKYEKSAPARKALEQVSNNAAVVVACESAYLKLDRDFWLGPVRDSITGVTPEIREEILMDLIAIDERDLEVYNAS